MNRTTFICQSSYFNATPAEDIDEFRCGLQTFAAFLKASQFGYICMGFSFAIVFISIFGGITENYRWFILHQALWDMLICFNYHCSIYLCFFGSFNFTIPFIPTIISIMVDYNPYTSIFFLSGSRFLALYYPQKYAKLFRTKLRILAIILIFYGIVAMLEVVPAVIQKIRQARLSDICQAQLVLGSVIHRKCLAEANSDTISIIYARVSNVFQITSWYLRPLFSLLLSILASIMLFIRISKNAKFQRQHNHKDFVNSVRICAVIVLQNFVALIVFLCVLPSQLYSLFFGMFLVKTVTAWNYIEGMDYTGYLDLRLPNWYDGKNGLASQNSLTMFIMIRLFIENVLVLVLMSGYREALLAFFKFVYLLIVQSKQAIQKFIPYPRTRTKIHKTTIF